MVGLNGHMDRSRDIKLNESWMLLEVVSIYMAILCIFKTMQQKQG